MVLAGKIQFFMEGCLWKYVTSLIVKTLRSKSRMSHFSVRLMFLRYQKLSWGCALLRGWFLPAHTLANQVGHGQSVLAICLQTLGLARVHFTLE